jgi:hypothetical protein
MISNSLEEQLSPEEGKAILQRCAVAVAAGMVSFTLSRRSATRQPVANAVPAQEPELVTRTIAQRPIAPQPSGPPVGRKAEVARLWTEVVRCFHAVTSPCGLP